MMISPWVSRYHCRRQPSECLWWCSRDWDHLYVDFMVDMHCNPAKHTITKGTASKNRFTFGFELISVRNRLPWPSHTTLDNLPTSLSWIQIRMFDGLMTMAAEKLMYITYNSNQFHSLSMARVYECEQISWRLHTRPINIYIIFENQSVWIIYMLCTWVEFNNYRCEIECENYYLWKGDVDIEIYLH